MKREEQIKMAKENREIFKQGFYTVGNHKMDISHELEDSFRLAYLITDEDTLALPRVVPQKKGEILVAYQSTLEAVFECPKDASVMVLNFASAKNPGGQWEEGSPAQEEYLAYRTCMVPTLEKFQEDFYEWNKRNLCGGMYHSNMIVSPAVPVIRNHAGALCAPKYIDIITCAAVNRLATNRRGITSEDVYAAMSLRIARIIIAAISTGCEYLVLGAFGCGVFRNKPEDIASIFKDILIDRNCRQYFKKVVFAILGEDNYATFKDVLTE